MIIGLDFGGESTKGIPMPKIKIKQRRKIKKMSSLSLSMNINFWRSKSTFFLEINLYL